MTTTILPKLTNIFFPWRCPTCEHWKREPIARRCHACKERLLAIAAKAKEAYDERMEVGDLDGPVVDLDLGSSGDPSRELAELLGGPGGRAVSRDLRGEEL